MAITFVSPFLILFLSISVFQVNGCNIDAVGGGCPDLTLCEQTCGGCYRGIGKVVASCEAPGAGVYWWICRCYFSDGAPCPPVGGPKCPDPPALAIHAPPLHTSHVVIHDPLSHPPTPTVAAVIV